MLHYKLYMLLFPIAMISMSNKLYVDFIVTVVEFQQVFSVISHVQVLGQICMRPIVFLGNKECFVDVNSFDKVLKSRTR